jgi:hypothetical protein
MKEVWKEINGFDGQYQVSNLGSVISLKYGKKKYLKAGVNNSGYYVVVLHKKGIRKSYNVHQLVAMAFLEYTPYSKSKLVVDHINNIKLNNTLSNLQITTIRHNSSKDKNNKSSKYTGVSWAKTKNKWVAQINIKGKVCHLGCYNNELEASKAYQNKLLNV